MRFKHSTLCDLHGSDRCHASEVIAHEVDNHRELSTILRALKEFARRNIGTSRAFDGSRRDSTIMRDAKKQFRTHRHEATAAGKIDARAEPRMVLGDRSVRECPRTARQDAVEASRDVRLIRITRADVLNRTSDTRGVVCVGFAWVHRMQLPRGRFGWR